MVHVSCKRPPTPLEAAAALQARLTGHLFPCVAGRATLIELQPAYPCDPFYAVSRPVDLPSPRPQNGAAAGLGGGGRRHGSLLQPDSRCVWQRVSAFRAPFAPAAAAARPPPATRLPSLPGNINYAPGACERLEPFLSSRILGQDMALRQISDAICDHLAQPEPARPLVLSLHGPPGVGKSMFHLLAAHALYNRQPDRPGLRCPGLDCAGYKVGRLAGSGGRAGQAQRCAAKCNGRRGTRVMLLAGDF